MKQFYVSLLLFLLGTSSLFASETIDGINYELNTTNRTATVVSGSYSGAIVIPESVNYNNREYTVTEIGESAFSSSSLTSIEIPSSVKSIGQHAFNNCLKLYNVVLSEGVNIIGAEAFSICSSLKKITIPSSVQRIERSAFKNCGLTSVILQEGLTYVGEYAFACNNISNITIPSTVTDMGSCAFYHCKMIKNINWNAKNCSDFYSNEQAPFSRHSNSPDSYFFYHSNYQLYYNDWTTSITFGDEVEHIPAYLCYNFRGELRNIVIPDNVRTIGECAFEGCTKLTSIKLGNGLEEIGKYAFSGCNALNSITIPDNVTAINKGAFQQCSGLKTITLGKNITTLGSQAFDQCPNITAINSYVVNPPSIESSVFSVSDLTAIYLNVREKALSAYKAANIWKEMNIDYFANDIRTYSLTVISADKSMGTTSPNGEFDEEEVVLISALPKAGYQFDHWSDGSKENPHAVTINGNLTFTAYFTLLTPQYTLTTTANPLEGMAVGGGTFESGVQVTLVAVANAGYHFTQWHDGNTDNPRIVTVSADAMYFANFAQDPVAPTLYELSVSSESPAKGWTTDGCAYEHGAQVMIYAHPVAGFEFSRWSDGNTDNPRFITITGEVNLTAQFVVQTTTNISAANISVAPAYKIIRDGQVYIERNGKVYTATGAEVK